MANEQSHRYADVKPANLVKLEEKKDEFKRIEFAKEIADSINSVDESQLPFCIGLFGRWGSGKTVLLNWIKDKLDKEKNIPIYISAKEPGSNLLGAIIKALETKALVESTEKESGRLSELANKVKKIYGSLASILPHLVSAGLGFTGLRVSPDVIREIFEAWEGKSDALGEFKSAVKEACGDGKRLVIIIDDLDRLPPTNAVSVLEEFELLFGLTPTSDEQKDESFPVIFIIAVDPEILKAGLIAKYGKDAFCETMAMAYIAKHFQVIENIPRTELEITKKLICREIGIPDTISSEIMPVAESGARSEKTIDSRIIDAATSNLRYFFQALSAAKNVETDEEIEQTFINSSYIKGKYELSLKGGESKTKKPLSVRKKEARWEAECLFRALFFFVYLLHLHAPEIIDWASRESDWCKWIALSDHRLANVDNRSQDAMTDITPHGGSFRGDLRLYVLRNTDVVRPLAGAINIVSRGNNDLVRQVVNKVGRMTRD